MTTTTTVIVADVPIAGLVVTNSSPTPLGQTTYFTATVTAGTNVLYAWDFGDGYQATGSMVNHVYTTPGIFTATVTVSNSQSSLLETTQVTIVQTMQQLFLPFMMKP